MVGTVTPQSYTNCTILPSAPEGKWYSPYNWGGYSSKQDKNRISAHVFMALFLTTFVLLTVDFKNELNALQYMDTVVSFKGRQIFRSKNGLRQKAMSSKTRYTPIFLLQTLSLGRLSLSGTCDVSDDGLTINDMALTGTKELISLSGEISTFSMQEEIQHDRLDIVL